MIIYVALVEIYIYVAFHPFVHRILMIGSKIDLGKPWKLCTPSPRLWEKLLLGRMRVRDPDPNGATCRMSHMVSYIPRSGKLEHVVAETHDAKMGLWSQFHLVFWQKLLGFGFPKSLFLRPTDDMGNTSSPSSPEQLHTYHLCLPVRWLESGKPTAQQFVAIPCTSRLHRSESRWLCHVLKCA